MRNTYINDNLNSPYPFYEDTPLPFPKSCIIGQSLCIRGTPGEAVYVSSVSITDSTVQQVVCLGASILGTIEIDRRKDSKSGALVQQNSNVQAIGGAQTGVIPASANGEYHGTFSIDPSCVLYMPDSVYGVHTALQVDGNTYDTQQLLNINAYGLITQNNTVLSPADQASAVNLINIAEERRYDRVTSLNQISATTTDSAPYDYTLEFTTQYPDTIRFSVVGGEAVPADPQDNDFKSRNNGKVTTVQIHGMRAFPNCYAKDLDNADDV